MMASVSTLARSSGATRPVRTRNACIITTLSQPTHVDEMAGDARRGRHCRTDQMRASAGALAPLEVAVRRRRATLARLQPVVVHGQAHRASGLAPLETSGGENAIEAFALGLRLYRPRAGNDHRQHHVVGLATALHHRC